MVCGFGDILQFDPSDLGMHGAILGFHSDRHVLKIASLMRTAAKKGKRGFVLKRDKNKTVSAAFKDTKRDSFSTTSPVLIYEPVLPQLGNTMQP